MDQNLKVLLMWMWLHPQALCWIERPLLSEQSYSTYDITTLKSRSDHICIVLFMSCISIWLWISISLCQRHLIKHFLEKKKRHSVIYVFIEDTYLFSDILIYSVNIEIVVWYWFNQYCQVFKSPGFLGSSLFQ